MRIAAARQMKARCQIHAPGEQLFGIFENTKSRGDLGQQPQSVDVVG